MTAKQKVFYLSPEAKNLPELQALLDEGWYLNIGCIIPEHVNIGGQSCGCLRSGFVILLMK